MKRKYKVNDREKYIMRYHLIFSTKYRKKLLGKISDDIKISMKRAESFQKDWKIEIMEIDSKLCDHIHFLIRGTPKTRIFEVVKLLKQTSTYDMWQKHHEYLSKFYWSGKHHLWTKGYFCSTVGRMLEDII